MSDKVTRGALVAALVVIGLLLLRPARTSDAGQASAPSVPTTQPVMAADNSTLYVLQGGKIYVYYWDSPAQRKLLPLSEVGKLRLLQVVDAGTSFPQASPSGR